MAAYEDPSSTAELTCHFTADAGDADKGFAPMWYKGL